MNQPMPGDPPTVCHDCGRSAPGDAPWCGRAMWHRRGWCCRHVTWTCPECWAIGKHHDSCPICGCKDEYT